MRTVLIVLAWLLTAALGALIIVTAVVGLLDPVGTQLANDTDPFGTPPGPLRGVVLLVAGIGLLAWPVLLQRYRRRRARGEARNAGEGEPGV